jgi:hypothetical protein
MESLPALNDIQVESLISQAIDRQVPVEALERLLAMRKELKAEAAREAFFRAKAVFQAEMPLITNTKEVRDKEGKLLYKYSPMSHLVKVAQPLLTVHGLSWALRSEPVEGGVRATCILTHSEGHTEEYPYTSPFMEGTKLSDRAKLCEGTRTVAKRCAFADALGITCQDEEVHSEEIRLISEQDVRVLRAQIEELQSLGVVNIEEETLAHYRITHLEQLNAATAEKLSTNLLKLTQQVLRHPKMS